MAQKRGALSKRKSLARNWAPFERTEVRSQKSFVMDAWNPRY